MGVGRSSVTGTWATLLPGRKLALPSDRVAFAGSFVPLAKSKSEKSDTVLVVAEPLVVDDVIVVEVVAETSCDPVVVAVDIMLDVDRLVMIVAAPAAKIQSIPAPKMEPVILTDMVCDPRSYPL
ncbi:hypothetical protein M527_22705 [Sphingobium indicum IP26]|nr:hypothetical protein M527_22705 [Sphingobium indicum IP26]